MIVRDTDIDGLKIIDIEPLQDDRGFFARSFCTTEFAGHNLEHTILQCNISHNLRRGTLRGMHYQLPPHEEVKMVRCIRGAVFDAVVDMRKTSATYLQWKGIELRADDYRMLYIPRGCAHGYQTLEDNTTVSYMVTESYHPGSERAVRWNDPLVKISWPLPDPILSFRDRHHPDFIP